MTTMPRYSALVYQENGACNLGQMLARPASMLFGRSFDKAGKEFQPTLLAKVAAVTLTIILLPLALPVIGMSLLALSLSSSHKAQMRSLELLFAKNKVKEFIDKMKQSLHEQSPSAGAYLGRNEIYEQVDNAPDLKTLLSTLQTYDQNCFQNDVVSASLMHCTVELLKMINLTEEKHERGVQENA